VEFTASYDRTTKIVSAVVCLGLLGIILAVHNLILAVLALLVLVVSFTYSPRGYVVEGQSILVKRLAGTVRVPLAGVREARKTTAEDWSGCIRLWGNGGLFGYYGLFSTSKLGRSTWYVTNKSNGVVVITAAKTVLLSPDDTDGFLATIRAVAPEAANENPAPAFAAARRSSALGTIIGIGIALIAVGLAVAAMTYSPGPPSFTLTSAALTIHDRFYPVKLQASGVDVNGIRIVDLNQNTGWRPTKRTNGFANSHYQSGWFQVANGEKVRLYRAGSSRVVLLPPSGRGSAVLYQAPDPEIFVEQVRTEWGRPLHSAAQGEANAGK
jgi:hypothetical protein